MMYPASQQPRPPKRRQSRLRTVGLIGLGLLTMLVVIAAIGAPLPSSSSSSNSSSPADPPTLTTAPAVAPVPAHTASDDVNSGTYKVGADIPAGSYRTAGPGTNAFLPSCYWARMRNDSGEISAIIANGNLSGPGRVTLKAGEFVEFSGDCTWTRA